MQLSGYPDLLGYLQRGRTAVNLKTRMDVVSQEAVTGIQVDKTQATQGRTGTAHLMLKALNDSEQFTRISDLSKTRLDLMSSAISGARTAMDGIGTRGIAVLEGGSAVGLQIIALEAEASLRSVVSAINIQQGPRNLLSGAATNQTALAPADEILNDIKAIMQTGGDAATITASIDDYFNDPAGGFATRIYTGGNSAAPALRIGKDTTLNVDIRANHDAIRDSLRGLVTIATAHLTPKGAGSDSFKDVMRTGLSAASQGDSGLIALEGHIGIHQETLNKAQTRNDVERSILSTAYQNLVGRDQFEAAAELQQLQVALESSYIITARLSELTLTNYIR